MSTLTPNGITTIGKLTKPAPVTPPVPAKKSKSRQQIIDIDATIPITRKRRESQSTELPKIDSTKLNGAAKDPPKTNKELFPSSATPSDIAVIANESEEDSKMPATTETIAAPPIIQPTTSDTGTNLAADPSIAIIPPASTSPPAKKKKLLPTFSLAVKPAVKPRQIILKGTPMIRAIVVGDSSTKTTVVFRTEKADKGSCWCDRRLEVQNNEENGWCRQLGMEPNWAKKWYRLQYFRVSH
jgi:hypothetical protein